jgi:hypothetical protein
MTLDEAQAEFTEAGEPIAEDASYEVGVVSAGEEC